MEPATVQFGSTRIDLIQGRPLQHLCSGLYAEANAHGVMAAGLSGEVRLSSGPDVERELRMLGPLLVGNAYVTGAGRLSSRGLQAIAHGIVTAEPGRTPKAGDVERAFTMGLIGLEDAGVRSITVSTIGWQVDRFTVDDAARVLTDTAVARLRRHARFTSIAVVSQHAEYLQSCHDRLRWLGGLPG